MKDKIASGSGRLGRDFLKAALLAGVAVFPVWAGLQGILPSGARTIVPEALALALFGGSLISLGLILRRKPSKRDSVQSDRG